ncbi:hypothetical protein BRC81_17080 [Halobacteriales archaeon QS_1_68_20]|nr:MAG: hypothetical protein BRC81_17080 [Halobacteriales archaeon QS_1_68_20]
MHRRTFLRSGAAALSLSAVDPAAASDPYRPLAVLDLPRAKDATVQRTTAYVGVSSGFAVVDVGTPGRRNCSPASRASRTTTPSAPCEPSATSGSTATG